MCVGGWVPRVNHWPLVFFGVNETLFLTHELFEPALIVFGRLIVCVCALCRARDHFPRHWRTLLLHRDVHTYRWAKAGANYGTFVEARRCLEARAIISRSD